MGFSNFANDMSCEASKSSRPSENSEHGSEDSENDDEEHESCPLMKQTPKRPENDLLMVGCGCFWTGQLKYQRLDGVMEVVAGYAGGHQPHPTYDEILDHTEALLIEYDPSQISYQQLLHIWTTFPNPDKPVGRRYRFAVWYLGEEQRILAEKVVQKRGNVHEAKTTKHSSSLCTAVGPATDFYRAESYHQDYYIRTGQARFVR